MADEPTEAERPEFTQEILDHTVAQGLAEDRARLAADQVRAAEKQRRAERRQAGI